MGPKAKGGIALSGRQVELCDRCGHSMYQFHCELICPNCGYRRDCSDP